MSCFGKKCGPLCGISKSTHGFVMGIAAGTLFGLLFAKRSGKELRKNLSEAGEKKGLKGAAGVLGKEVMDISQDVKATTREVTQSDTFKKAVSKGKETASQLKEKGMEMASNIKEKVSQMKDQSDEVVSDSDKKPVSKKEKNIRAS